MSISGPLQMLFSAWKVPLLDLLVDASFLSLSSKIPILRERGREKITYLKPLLYS